jgi:hypothetical protein
MLFVDVGWNVSLDNRQLFDVQYLKFGLAKITDVVRGVLQTASAVDMPTRDHSRRLVTCIEL